MKSSVCTTGLPIWQRDLNLQGRRALRSEGFELQLGQRSPGITGRERKSYSKTGISKQAAAKRPEADHGPVARNPAGGLCAQK